MDVWEVVDEGAAVASPKSPDHSALGEALRALRNEQGLTLEQLGARVTPDPMNPRYISACERGEVNVSFGNLIRLSRALDTSLVEVVTRYEATRPSQPVRSRGTS